MDLARMQAMQEKTKAQEREMRDKEDYVKQLLENYNLARQAEKAAAAVKGVNE